ncbi:hypothetical protein NK553_13245 [Pseudomonas sp. ZM23]|uniref:Uncharacterized protein n=1 Tax=Pseudomonas triclosanedens TaxID=2961893 RepID=A0ABY7A3K3_9PSED|nr:hypothetical protein [Pseudomonas triclosanedens]MCP8464913.1 hypothetical protein [Pseudomonas triclosanedens]MCP8470375.1 hypothetical protein [Pseudomonas triclosanedens]MCP8476180.1 hypothetical protein [Pseudomonas triclosanedens]WAI51586.1 hypothetical protein OU419_10165 [Pseudomonas triclosanedens]
MQVILDFLLLVGSLAELLLYVALASVALAALLMLSAVAVLTLRSPGQPIRIPERRRPSLRKPHAAAASEPALAKTA